MIHILNKYLHGWVDPFTLPTKAYWVYITRIMIELKNNLIFYLKWASTLILVSGMLLTALNIHPLNLYLSLSGVLGWFLVGFLWHDRSVIVLNIIGITIYTGGIISNLLK